jgi:hypothetical protein
VGFKKNALISDSLFGEEGCYFVMNSVCSLVRDGVSGGCVSRYAKGISNVVSLH